MGIFTKTTHAATHAVSHFRALKDDAKGAWRSYDKMLKTHPLLTNCFSGGLIMITGDAIAQKIEKQGQEEEESGIGIDTKRTLVMTSYSTLMYTPSQYYWFRYLDRLYPTRVSGNLVKGHVVRKIALSMASSWPITAFFFLYASTMEGFVKGQSIKSGWDKGVSKIEENLVSTCVRGHAFWGPLNLVNFLWLPSHLRVLYVSLTAVTWNSFLSMVQHVRPESEAKNHTTVTKSSSRSDRSQTELMLLDSIVWTEDYYRTV